MGMKSICLKKHKGKKEGELSTMQEITVGIIGCGFIGGALKKWLEEHNPNIDILVSDPPKGMNDDVTIADVIFISIHIPTENDGTQNLDLLKELIKPIPQNTPIFVRTTVLPTTCDNLSAELGKRVYFMPEFLTERTAYQDFCTQPMIFTAEESLLKRIFIGKKYITMSSLEAEITKYAHNDFGAVKVTYFNAIYDLCQKMHCDYKKVQNGVLLSGYINDMHTHVPGPDGKLGYGGKCFPKDVKAIMHAFKNQPIEKILSVVDDINDKLRNVLTRI